MIQQIASVLPPDHPVYTRAVRKRRYGRAVSVLDASTAHDCLSVLRRTMRDVPGDEHQQHAHSHALAAIAAQQRYRDELDAAAIETFGRPFQITDDKVSGVGCDEFSLVRKDRLRGLVQVEGRHHRLAIVHAMAAGRQHAAALAWFDQLRREQSAAPRRRC